MKKEMVRRTFAGLLAERHDGYDDGLFRGFFLRGWLCRREFLRRGFQFQ